MVVTKEQMKAAFRAAFNFMEAHNRVLENHDEIVRLATYMKNSVAENGNDPLTIHLLAGVYEFICEQSSKEKRNDAGGTAERP